MSLSTQNIPVFGPLGPLGPKDTYPTHDALYGLGGFMQVSSIEERDSIPEERRRIGLQVLVSDYLNINELGVYVLEDGVTNNDWVHINESIYSSSYGPQVIFADQEPRSRRSNAPLRDGDLWIHSNNYYLYAYSLPEDRWILLTGPGVVTPDPETPGGGSGGAFPGVNPRYPVNTLPINSDEWDNGTMSLTASGCIEISLDNITYSQGPITIEDDDVLWTRWRDTVSCAQNADGTVLNGVITNGIYLAPGTITLQKVPQDFNFSDLIDQQVSSVSSSNVITLVGLNANTKIWAPTGTGAARQISINGGSWISLPSSVGSALTVPFQLGGPTIRIRHTNSASLSSASVMQVRVGDADINERYVSTIWSTTTVSSGPSINQPSIVTPVNNATEITIPTTVTSSTYVAINGAGVHASSDWQVNSGALGTTSTNSITGMSYINTDLGPDSWTHIPSSGGATFPSGTDAEYNMYFQTKVQDYVGVPYIPNALPQSFTVRSVAYSNKLNRWVAVGDANGVARLSYIENRFAISFLNTWVNIPIDLSDPARKGFRAVVWDSKNQVFLALRDVQNPGSATTTLVYSSTNGSTFTEVSTSQGISLNDNIRDFGDLLFYPGASGAYYTSTNGINFINNGVHPLFGTLFGRRGSLTKVRNKWFNNNLVQVSGFPGSYNYTSQPYNSDDFVDWESIDYVPNSAPFILGSSNYEQGLSMFNPRSHHDAFFFKGADNKTYYTIDGETVLPLQLRNTSDATLRTGHPYVYSLGGYYYIVTWNSTRDGTWRAPRTMIQLNIQGANSNGFSVGQRIKVNGLSLTYGWIHSITSTTITLRGAYGNWANSTGYTISTDTGDAGLGLIVDVTDDTTNKTSYPISSGLMSANLNYYARVRYGDGTIKSAWSPWSKFTTGD